MYIITCTGFGWLRMKIRRVIASGEADGSSCETNSNMECDPYLILYIDDEEVIRTPTREDTTHFDANVDYASKKILKTANIKIEVWDDDSGFLGSPDDLIMRTEGNVESFLNNGIREGAKIASLVNRIETISVWKDDFE